MNKTHQRQSGIASRLKRARALESSYCGKRNWWEANILTKRNRQEAFRKSQFQASLASQFSCSSTASKVRKIRARELNLWIHRAIAIIITVSLTWKAANQTSIAICIRSNIILSPKWELNQILHSQNLTKKRKRAWSLRNSSRWTSNYSIKALTPYLCLT